MYKDLNIAVIGDIMLDHWREGTEYKLNPESPTIDIINPNSQYTLGGAGNVARIVRGLGARVQLIGMLGEFSPYANSKVLDMCDKVDIGFYVAYEQRVTTVKERIVCGGQQICRISEENTDWITHEAAKQLIEYVDNPIIPDGIIIADYSKGVMRDMLIHGVMHIAKEYDIPVLVDPKNRMYIYKGCTIMKPNMKEYEALVDPGLSSKGFFEKLDCEHLVITNETGIIWRCRNEEWGEVDAYPVEVANVSGCGDSVAAVMLLEYIRNSRGLRASDAEGNKIEGAVKLANWAASKVVQRDRTGHLEIEDLIEYKERGDEQGDLSGQGRRDKQTTNQSS